LKFLLAIDIKKPDLNVNDFDLAGAPGLVEPCLKRAVEAKQGIPTLAGNGLHPVILRHPRLLKLQGKRGSISSGLQENYVIVLFI
jgi:hypothetical protein